MTPRGTANQELKLLTTQFESARISQLVILQFRYPQALI